MRFFTNLSLKVQTIKHFLQCQNFLVHQDTVLVTLICKAKEMRFRNIFGEKLFNSWKASPLNPPPDQLDRTRGLGCKRQINFLCWGWKPNPRMSLFCQKGVQTDTHKRPFIYVQEDAGAMSCVVLCSTCLTLGGDCATSPLPDPLESLDKRHRHTVVQFQLAFPAQLLGATISCLEKHVLTNFLSISLTCAILQLLNSASPCQISLTTCL